MKNMIKNFRGIYHGKGYLGYSSIKSQELFLSSVLKISDKLFWSPLAALASLLTGNGALATFTIIGCGVLTAIAMYMRHGALKGFDEIESRKKLKEKQQRFSRKKCI